MGRAKRSSAGVMGPSVRARAWFGIQVGTSPVSPLSYAKPAPRARGKRIRSGETIGVIGGTGSGKSSLVNLICRLYDVDDGAVRVGGVDVRRYDMAALRNQVSVVLQKNTLFSGTILENLRWGNPDATDEECIAACKAACADEFIDRMPEGYHTRIERGGANVSGGQKQRLCIARLAYILAVGVAAAFGYNRIMVTVSQGTMRRLRDDLFRKMESLPISYFDTHAHGDITSVYTNDIDTLRQLLSQSIPQIINTTVTMLATLVTMILLNPALTVISLLTACVMVAVTVNFSKLSGKYYLRQQQDLGAVDGFIEEMLDGQKVVKVFCHEDAARRDFRAVNDRLRDSADKANRYANLLMPINRLPPDKGL